MSELYSLYLHEFVPYLVVVVWLVFTGSSLYLQVSDPYLVDERVWLVVFTGVIKHLDKVGGHVFY